MRAANPSLLSANELTLAYGHQVLLAGVTLAVAPGEKVGLVGRNGCGKTSLLKILSGEQEADSGEISRRRGLRVGYLPQEFELDGTRTVRENIEAGASDLIGWLRRYEEGNGSDAELSELLEKIQHADGWNLESRIRAEASALGVAPLDSLVGRLSGGEKRRVALCRALAAQPDLLLLDEPTNHLDAESIRWLEDCLRNFPGAVIFVTHDRYFLDVIATRIMELSDGRVFSHPGNYTAFLEAKSLRQQITGQSERRRQRFLRAELEWVKAGVRAQRSKARHRLDTYYATAGMEAPPEEREMDLLIPPAPDMGNVGVELTGAGARVPGDGRDRWLFRDLTVSLRAGQCTGVIGRNGVGKTTLLRLCLGERPADAGDVRIGKKVIVNYIDQVRMQLDPAKTVLEEIADADETVMFGGKGLSVRGYLRRFLFADDRVHEIVGKLSGGERARLMLAKVLKRGGNLLVLDEPTNDLDLPSLRMLEEALVRFDGAVLVVSHDRYFLDRICDQVVAFEDDGLVIQQGNYSYYLEKKKDRDQQARAVAPVATPRTATSPPLRTPPGPVPPKPRKLTFKEQRELEGIEAAIHEAEARVRTLEATFDDLATYTTRAAEVPAMLSELEDAKAGVARLYERWAALERVGS